MPVVLFSPPREALISGDGRLRPEISLILRLTPAPEHARGVEGNQIFYSTYGNPPSLPVSGVLLIIDASALTSAKRSLTILNRLHRSRILKIPSRQIYGASACFQ